MALSAPIILGVLLAMIVLDHRDGAALAGWWLGKRCVLCHSREDWVQGQVLAGSVPG